MTPFDIIKENLSLLTEEESGVSEKKLYELSELSRVVYERIQHDLRSEESESLFHYGATEAFSFTGYDPEALPSEYVVLLKEKRRLSSLSEICAFSVFLSERIKAENKDYTPWREISPSAARVVYVPARRAEKAYFALSALNRNASVLYADSAADAVSALLAHHAEYALLPYMSAKGEPLSGISRLFTQNDLCFSALVASEEGEDRLVYALVSTELCPFAETDRMALSFKITADSYAHLGSILSAIPVFGYTQTSLSTESEEYGRVRARLSLVGEGDATALWIYLSLYAVGVSHLGRYPIIEIEER